MADKDDDGVHRALRDLSPDDLPEGDVTIRVGWSSVNYKDALAVSPKGRVAKTYPLVPGIDLAGEVIESDAGGDLAPGATVLAHGHEIGVGQHRRLRRDRARARGLGDPATRRPERA